MIRKDASRPLREHRGPCFVDRGGVVEAVTPDGVRRTLGFPVLVAVARGRRLLEVTADFVFCPGTRRLRVATQADLPRGSRLNLHFYIPPQSKLLGVLRGRVQARGRDPLLGAAAEIRITSPCRGLADYLGERRPLVDLHA